MFVLVEPSLLHHTFLLGPARFTALAISALVSLMFLTHFDALCDLLLDTCTATWNLFVSYHKASNFVRIKAALFHVRRAKVGRSPF